MVNKNIILNLYDGAVSVVKDFSNPYANLMEPYSVLYEANHVGILIQTYNIKSIADLGCGSGNMLRLVNGAYMRDVTYSGFDLNPNFIKYCTNRYPKGIFQEYDISKKKLENDYDLILIYETFAYFTDEEIIDMIEYYYSKANRVLSFVLLDRGSYDSSLNIIQVKADNVLNAVKDKYNKVEIDHDSTRCKYYIDIIKEEGVV